MSIYVGKLVDNVLPGGNLNLLNLLGLAMVLIIVLRLFLSFSSRFLFLKQGRKLMQHLYLLLSPFVKTSPDFFDNMRTGEIISRIGDAVKIRVFINEVSINLS